MTSADARELRRLERHSTHVWRIRQAALARNDVPVAMRASQLFTSLQACADWGVAIPNSSTYSDRD
jgi:hypothetical protein